MKKSQQGSTMVISFIFTLVLLLGGSGSLLWKALSQQSKSNISESASGTYQTVTSTMKDWTVSLQAPANWKVETKDDGAYNYDTNKKELVKNTILTDPSGKVRVFVSHMPFFSADGVCGESTIRYLHKEPMQDKRLTFVEAVGNDQRGFLIGAMSTAAASVVTDQFKGCFMYRSYINQDGMSVLPQDELNVDLKKPFVSISISPVLKTEQQQRSWNAQKTIDLLKTKEYLEAKAIVKSLQI